MDRTGAEGAIEVEISDTQGHLRMDHAELISLVRVVLTAEGRAWACLSIALVDQVAIHAINRSHLNHDWPTDVISFPLSEPADPVLAGELVVSAEMAANTAAEIGVDPRDELALYVVHGLLHLCSYDDRSDDEAARMRRREGELMIACGRSNPYDIPAAARDPATIDAPSIAEEASIPVRRTPPVTHQSEPSSWSR